MMPGGPMIRTETKEERKRTVFPLFRNENRIFIDNWN